MKLSMIQNLAIWGDSLLKGIIFDEKTSRYKPLKTCSVNLFSKAFPFTVKKQFPFWLYCSKGLGKSTGVFKQWLAGRGCTFGVRWK